MSKMKIIFAHFTIKSFIFLHDFQVIHVKLSCRVFVTLTGRQNCSFFYCNVVF